MNSMQSRSSKAAARKVAKSHFENMLAIVPSLPCDEATKDQICRCIASSQAIHGKNGAANRRVAEALVRKFSGIDDHDWHNGLDALAVRYGLYDQVAPDFLKPAPPASARPSARCGRLQLPVGVAPPAPPAPSSRTAFRRWHQCDEPPTPLERVPDATAASRMPSEAISAERNLMLLTARTLDLVEAVLKRLEGVAALPKEKSARPERKP